MASVPLYYEIHIRPMFREIDREHMLQMFSIDLWDYDYVKSHLVQLKGYITAAPSPNDPRGVMPPTDSGGPWPAEWIATFLRWIDEGAKSLPLGTATYSVGDLGSDDQWALSADGSPSQKDAAVWLERSPVRGTTPIFTLYEKPPLAGAAGTGDPFSIAEVFVKGAATVVTVIDRNGKQDIALI